MVHVLTAPPTTVTNEQVIWLAGPRLVGLLFNWGLLGVLTTQVYIYHVNFPKDRLTMKFLVYFVYLLDLAQTGSATYDAFQWFIYGFGNAPNLYLRYSGFLNIPLLGSTIGAIVQIFYGWRIWSFSRSRIIFGLVCAVALVQWSAGLITGYYMFMDASEMTKNQHYKSFSEVRLAASAIVDVVIATSMTYFLFRRRGQALGPMNNFVNRRLTVETGTISVVVALVDLVFFLKEHNAMMNSQTYAAGIHELCGVILCKIYSNIFLVLFNNRLVNLNQTLWHSTAEDQVVSALEFRVGPRMQRSTTVGDNWELPEKDSIPPTTIASPDSVA
ncbi:hypothetical protein B0H11DRAFT_2037485 [Mycena galericulata]|nr:hypothetical protein B0H11DRAFT_2037485 [Mycena galericulata]